VLKAATALSQRVPNLVLGAFRLTKNLPTAAGLGGGSADAGAALRLLARSNGLALDDSRVVEAARAVGADGAVCLASVPALMRGAGEHVTPLRPWPELHAVLANPNVAVPTRAVFEALAVTIAASAHPPLGPDIWSLLAAAGNDLGPPARRLAPAIAAVEGALAAAGARLVRMSGSGATVFGLFDDRGSAERAAHAVSAHHPQWWVRATRLAGASS
jgi:4-diphosphocytidyl-2-C-methyl-D-erythritol kinase